MFTEIYFVILKSQKQYKTPLVEEYAAIEVKEIINGIKDNIY